uniref:PH domain-containing protein n=1 Tax=Lotharella globosa TaxID=91324 RepID=A0A6U3E1W6_9EUKA|mmetsp:Transcript_7016/g.13727  ORF Transcript_7016/g.13727 Transcript_7016/m.13727 type:complete len:131 (-) Transcript_7016:179-571(-)
MSDSKGKTGKIQCKSISKEGYLEKQSRFLKTWRKRWFVLDGSMLYSFKKERVYENPTEVIDLKVFSSVKSSEDYTNRQNSFDVYSKDMSFSMVAPSSGEKEDWIRNIGRAIITSRNNWQTDYNDKDSDSD